MSTERVEQMTTWRTTPPTGRVWALVLVRGYPVPDVMQYEPRFGLWVTTGGDYPASECEWHPLPYHPSYGEMTKTHAVEIR